MTTTASANGAGGVAAALAGAGAENAALHDELDEIKRGWFTRLVTWYVRVYATKRAAAAPFAGKKTQTQRAERACRVACVKSALTGAAAGATTTGATVITASTEGLGGLIAVPVAVTGIFGEMIYRAFVHVELTCQLAEIFDVHIDPNDPKSIWRLYALAFCTEEHEPNSEDPGKGLMERVLDVEGEQVGDKIGSALMGESVVRNIVPFIGIASSSITNYMTTRRLGDTLRRYFRFRRALEDSLERAGAACESHLDLLVEGLWFVFTADGKLAGEEAATLAWMLKRFPEAEQDLIHARFVEDENDWIDRLETLPVPIRKDFFYALEVAATVDKEVSLPERKLLRRVAKHLGVTFDMARLERMIEEFEKVGVLAEAL